MGLSSWGSHFPFLGPEGSPTLGEGRGGGRGGALCEAPPPHLPPHLQGVRAPQTLFGGVSGPVRGCPLSCPPPPLPSPPPVPARVPVASPERAPELRAPGEGSAPAGRGGPGQTRGGVLRPPRPQIRPGPPQNPRRAPPDLGLRPKSHGRGDLGAQSSAPPGRAPTAAPGEGVWGGQVRDPPPPPQIWGLRDPQEGTWGRQSPLRTQIPLFEGHGMFCFFLLKTFIFPFNKNNSSRSL